MPSNEVSTLTRGLNENLLFRTHWVTFTKVGLCNFGNHLRFEISAKDLPGFWVALVVVVVLEWLENL